MVVVVLLTKGAQRVRHLLLLLVAGLPGRNEVVGLEERELLIVGSAHIEAVLVEHDGLADGLTFLALLYSETIDTGQNFRDDGYAQGELLTLF